MALLILLNNFLHDFSAAGWLFCSLLLYKILKNNFPKDEGGKILSEQVRTILSLMKVCLAGIVILGVNRALAYKAYEWSEAAGQSQIILLVVKHVLLAFIFFYGMVLFIKAKKRITNSSNEKE